MKGARALIKIVMMMNWKEQYLPMAVLRAEEMWPEESRRTKTRIARRKRPNPKLSRAAEQTETS